MILISNCPHDNGIYTLIDKTNSVVVKSSYTVNGMARLSQEYAGYKWYFKQKSILDHNLLRFVKRENGLYCKLYTKIFPGRSGECYNSIDFNQHELLKAIDTYSKVWPRQKGKLAPMHGDFSLGNLILFGEETTIIDWEHFQHDAAPWGFDLVNLLYESVFFSFKDRDTLSQRDTKVFFEVRKAVCDLIDPEEGFDCKIQNLTKFVENNVYIWGALVNKLPVMKFSDSQINFLMEIERHYPNSR